MSKFIITKNVPEVLEKGEYIISRPDFKPEIQAAKAKKPRSNAVTINYLREVIAAIGNKYIGEDFDTLRAVNASKYVGVPCETEEQMNELLIKAFEQDYPQLIHAYVHAMFKQRPTGTNLIYFSGGTKFCTKLIELGLEQINVKDLEKLQNKTKKVVEKTSSTN